MRTVTVYSSAPISTKLAVAFYNLSCLGLRVEVKPLEELPVASKRSPQPEATLRAQWEAVSVELATIGERLNEHELGRARLGAGEEQGLRALRDSLQARQRGLAGSLKGLGGG